MNLMYLLIVCRLYIHVIFCLLSLSLCLSLSLSLSVCLSVLSLCDNVTTDNCVFICVKSKLFEIMAKLLSECIDLFRALCTF